MFACVPRFNEDRTDADDADDAAAAPLLFLASIAVFAAQICVASSGESAWGNEPVGRSGARETEGGKRREVDEEGMERREKGEKGRDGAREDE